MKVALASVNRPFLKGAGRRIRTDDLLITNQLLYQLSYTGIYRGKMAYRRQSETEILYGNLIRCRERQIGLLFGARPELTRRSG